MLYILYNQNFKYVQVECNNSNWVVDNVYGMNHKINKHDIRPFVSILRKHPLNITDCGNGLSKTAMNFVAIHKSADEEEYNDYIATLGDVDATQISQCILVESNIDSDSLLMLNYKTFGTFHEMTNVWEFDVYAGHYEKKNRIQLMLKVNRSFKLQEYVYHKEIATVRDHVFSYHHMKDSLVYTYKNMKFDKDFYVKNKKTFEDEGRFKYPKYDLFFVRNIKEYPR